MKTVCLLAFLSALACLTAAQTGALMPYSQSPRTDKLGNEWNIEQNGMLNRPGSGNSVISGCAALMIGNQQFYCNQPMATPDGRELVMQGGQAIGGVSITRRIRFLEKEGGVRYLEQFTNSLGSDATITVEVRHNFNNSGRAFVSDRARPCNNKLEETESGVVVLPGQGSTGSPSLLLTVSTPRSTDKPRIAGRNQYQLSFFHTLTVPAGKTASIIHTIGQAKTSLTPDEEELQKLFRPLALNRMMKDIPRDMAATIVNLKAGSTAEGLQIWFPTEFWGIKPETFDVLAIGDATRLKGKTACARLSIKHSLGDQIIPWEEVAALAGSRFAGQGLGCVWLRDGERITGQIEAQELRFTLVSGLSMDLKTSDLDRVVIGGPGEAKWPGGVAGFVETQEGDRYALTATDAVLPVVSLWGGWQIDLKELVTLTAPEEGSAAGLARMRDGSRIRVMPADGTVSLPLKRFGSRTLQLASIRQLITAEASKQSPDADEDPVRSFIDLAGEQRLIARVTGANIRLATSGGLVELSPASIREMRDVTEEQEASDDGGEERLYQASLWGGGTVIGRSADPVVKIEGDGFAWSVPMRHVFRVANPVPKIEAPVMARIGVLIRELGDENWKTREQASKQLKELGALARPSLQEALKQSTDAEVTRRIEELLESME